MKGKFRKIATARISNSNFRSAQTSKGARNRILPYFCLIPNALALDAALFATCWQGMANGSFGMAYSWFHGLLVVLAVWLGYTADRLVDAVGMKQNAQTVRHRLVQRHRKALFFAWVIVLAGSITLAVTYLSSKELVTGFALAMACVSNACLNYLDPTGRLPIPKELRASVLLASGIHWVLWSQLTAISFPFVLSCLAVTLLCFINCCFISKWERQLDVKQGQSSLALRRKFVSEQVAGITLVTATLCLLIGALGAHCPQGLMFQATAVALFALPIIDHTKLHLEDKRIIADASLFLPFLLLVS